MKQASAELKRASPEDQRVFENLWELYLYDFSEMNPKLDLDECGQFGGAPLRYWTEPQLDPFLIYVDGRPSGFSLVNRSEERNRIGQFFVIRKHRGEGIGGNAAVRSFDLFPGNWVVGVVAANELAQTFWRTTIGKYTDGRFVERQSEDGIDFLFSNIADT